MVYAASKTFQQYRDGIKYKITTQIYRVRHAILKRKSIELKRKCRLMISLLSLHVKWYLKWYSKVINIKKILLFVYQFGNRLDQLSYIRYSFTFCISGIYWKESGVLLKDVMGHVEVFYLLSFDGWLTHGQSCHISYFI